MNLSLSDEQVALQDSVRSLLEDAFPTTALRDCEADPSKARNIYAKLFDLGIGGILASETSGGLALGLTDMVVVQAELGRALVPMLAGESTVGALTLLLACECETDAALSLISSLIDGTALAACAFDMGDAPPIIDAGTMTLRGELRFVGEPVLASHIFVRAVDMSGVPTICAVPTGVEGSALTELPNLADLSLANLSFNDAPVLIQLASGDRAETAWQLASDRMKIAIAAQAVGGAGKILEVARDYAATRKQFGQPIGSFQAIAHMLADAAVNLEGARMLVFRAATAADEGEPFSTWANMAKLKACQTFRDVSAAAIQVHGGIGFTLEADPQLFYRRAKYLQLMYGEPLDLEERTGAALLSGKHRVLQA